MPNLLPSCLFALLFTTNQAVASKPTIAVPVSSFEVSPSQAYFQLANDIAGLFQQIERLPAAQASALLRQKAPSLQLRMKQVKPAYQKYLESLSTEQLAAEGSKAANSPWGKYFSRLEATGLDASPKLKELMKAGNLAGQLLLDLMGVFDGI